MHEDRTLVLLRYWSFQSMTVNHCKASRDFTHLFVGMYIWLSSLHARGAPDEWNLTKFKCTIVKGLVSEIGTAQADVVLGAVIVQ